MDSQQQSLSRLSLYQKGSYNTSTMLRITTSVTMSKWHTTARPAGKILLWEQQRSFVSLVERRAPTVIWGYRPMKTVYSSPLAYMCGIAGTLTLSVAAAAHWAWADVVPLSRRRRWIFTSSETAHQLVENIYRHKLKKFNGDVLPPDHPLCESLCRVGRRVEGAAVEFAKRNNIASYVENGQQPFTYAVVNSDEVGCELLGNHILAGKGFLEHFHGDDELAAIVGREVARNVARQTSEKMSGYWLRVASLCVGCVIA